jgi:hypothetical protein
MKTLILVIIFGLLCVGDELTAQNKPVVQFDIRSILNARPITTLTGNKLITWTKGIDGNGSGDGYLTRSAAIFNGNKDAHALPDDALFPANASHPEIKLHYSNSDSLDMQACFLAGESIVEFKVPGQKYRTIYLALTSAEGPSNLHIRFTYDTGTAAEDFILPDYYNDIKPGDPNLCYLAHDLAKWGNKNNMTEKDHHNIDLLKIEPDPKRVLKAINISKSKPGYLVFWAAAGIKAE